MGNKQTEPLRKHEKILSDTVPLIFQWLPKEFGATVPNVSPNGQSPGYQYLQRLVDWAILEPQREIYLVINGAGFRSEQIKDLETQLKPLTNVHVVDFNKITLDKDITLPIGNDVRIHFKKSTLQYHRGYNREVVIEEGGIKLSDLLQRIYPKDNNDQYIDLQHEQLDFAIVLDLMRLSILQNIDKITNTQEAIYLDFDILPDQTGAQIGEVNIPNNILMARSWHSSGCPENSIIAINDLSQSILEEVVPRAQFLIAYYPISDTIHDAMVDVIYSKVPKSASNKSPKEQFAPYYFQDCGGKVQVAGDKSWENTINYAKQLPIYFVTPPTDSEIAIQELKNIAGTMKDKIVPNELQTYDRSKIFDRQQKARTNTKHM